MKKEILITGGSGFIGYHLIKKLKKNYNIISLSSKKPDIKRKVNLIKYIKCDIYNKKLLYKKLKKLNPSFVINLAGYIDHSNKTKTLNSHFNGCKNLVDYFSSKKIELFIQFGSSLEYGKQGSPHHENLKCKPRAIYGQSKLKSTNYILKTSKRNNFPFAILRLYQIYGPNQSLNRLIPIVISSCLNNKRFNCSSGVQIRDFLYVDDLIDLIIMILKSKKKINGIFNVGSKKPVKVKEVINSIRNKIKKGFPQYGKISMRDDESLKYFPDVKKISKQFSWRPKTSLDKGLEKTINFYKSL